MHDIPVHRTKNPAVCCIPACILSAAVLLIGWCYRDFGGAALKHAAGLLFVALSIWCALCAYSAHHRASVFLMFAVQLLYCAADEIIRRSLVSGMLWFGAGHMLLLIGLIVLFPPRWSHLIGFAAAACVSAGLLHCGPRLYFGWMRSYALAYGTLLTCILGKALSLLFERKLHPHLRAALFLGVLLFLLSDWALAVNRFGLYRKAYYGRLCLTLYYPAECLLALSCLYPLKSPRNAAPKA